MKGYLSEVQIKELEDLKFQSLIDVYYHFWVKDDFNSLDWIELVFSKSRRLGLATGDLAEDIKVVDFSKDSMSLQGEYELQSKSMIKSKEWKPFENQILMDYEVTDNGYCNGSIIFQFGTKKVEILALLDNVKPKFFH